LLFDIRKNSGDIMVRYGIKYLDIYESFGDFIASHVPDIKPGRNSRWVFPDFPSASSSLPQITIKLESPEYETESAGNIYYEEYDSVYNIYKEYFYKKATATLHLYVLTGRTQEITAVLDGVNKVFKDKMLNYYLTNLVKVPLLSKRGELLSELQDLRLLNVDSPYEGDKNMWVSDIKCEVVYKDTWVNEYQDGELLRTYSLIANIE